MNKLFNSIKSRKPKADSFNLSHENKMSMKMGNLVPFLVQEVVPGDSFKINSEVFMRLAPMVSPVMHRVNVKTHFFWVANRTIWDEWEDFITGGKDGKLEPVFPRIPLSQATVKKGTLMDYMGIPSNPVGTSETEKQFNALPFRAYLEIYNQYFRDQNVEDEIPFSKGSTTSPEDLVELSTLRNRAWEKDYFTSCLPWAQRGDEVYMPVDGVGTFSPKYKAAADDTVHITGGGALGDGDINAVTGVNHIGVTPGTIENLEDPQSVDLEGNTFTINALRQAVRLQEWLEKNARGGARYIEQILSHFGVHSSDARLQRPELIGGGRANVVISEVLNQTGALEDEGGGADISFSPQGNMAGHGIAAGGGHKAKFRAEEHGYIIGLISVLPRTAYQDGIERHWTKFNKYDYFWPEFAHLGEQEVLNQELWFDWSSGENSNFETFGYQSRYAEYKFRQSTVHGDFREELNHWHMGRAFEALPLLNSSFIISDPTTRIFALDDELLPSDEQEDQLYVQVYHKIRAIRPMPTFGTPRL